VRAARKAHIDITVLPGPSAVTAAVALSGLVDGPFSFIGFLPRKGSKRANALSSIAGSAVPQIIFESPHRIKDTLIDLQAVCGDERRICVCREVTKKFEETLVLPLSEIAAEDFRENWQGEFTLVVEKSSHPGRTLEENFDVDARIQQLLNEGNSVKLTTQLLTKELQKRGEKTSRRELYSKVLALDPK